MRFLVLAVLIVLALNCGGGGSDATPSPVPSPEPTEASVRTWRDITQLRDAVINCSEQPNHIIEDWLENATDWSTPGIDEAPEDFIARVEPMLAAREAMRDNFQVIADWLAANHPSTARALFEGFMDSDWSYLMYDCVARSLD